jgi:hypothetical protein
MLPRMTLPLLQRAAALSIAAGLLAVACSSSSSPPQAYAKVVLSPGPNGAKCAYQSDMTVLAVGSATSPNDPTRVATGTLGDHVACTVHPDGSNFDISLDVGTSGAMASELIVTGQVSAQGSTTLTADVSLSSANTAVAGYGATMTCTFTPTQNTAATRIWGQLSCPSAVNSIGGGTDTCDIEATILFEYCSS